MSSVAIVDCRRFYAEYFGHEVGPLRVIHDTLRKTGSAGPRPCIFLAGDSSLDNKVWFRYYSRTRSQQRSEPAEEFYEMRDSHRKASLSRGHARSYVATNHYEYEDK